MLIGIVADTHNDIEMTRKAIEIFSARKVEFIFHAGDLTSPKILDLFKGFNCRFVLGNSDIDSDLINMKSETLGFGTVDNCCELELAGKKFLLFHGNDVPKFRDAVSSGRYDYIIKGHTHFFENYVSSTTRIINPGTLYGTEERTIAILDTDSDRVEKIKIDEE